MKLVEGVAKVAIAAVKAAITRYNELGQELVDGRPMQVPTSLKGPLSTADLIQQMVRNTLVQQQLNQAGFETFEESQDFDIPDDMHPISPHEMLFEPEDVPAILERMAAGKPPHDVAPAHKPVLPDRGGAGGPLPPSNRAPGGGAEGGDSPPIRETQNRPQGPS